MKRHLFLAALLFALGLPFGSQALVSTPGAAAQDAATQEPKKMPDVLILAKDGKLGPVTFSHTNHTTKNYNISGTGPIECIECHHTAQPASEVAKHPPLKTAWPADRTTTLTLDLYKNNNAAIGTITCRGCHARAGMTPTTIPETPQIKAPDNIAFITLTNQLAFHRNCANCHAEVAKNRKDVKAPMPQQCSKCHNKG